MLQQKYVRFYNIMYIFIHSREYLVSFAQYNSLHIPLSSVYFSPYPSSANRYVIPFSTIIFANLFSLIVKSFLPGALHPDLHLFTISNNLFSPNPHVTYPLLPIAHRQPKNQIMPFLNQHNPLCFLHPHTYQPISTNKTSINSHNPKRLIETSSFT